MLTLQQYTTKTCAVCKAHRPMLAELEKDYEGDLKVEFVDVSSLPEEEASLINTVPLYKLLSADGAVLELWVGTKSKEQVQRFIDCALETQ